MEVVWMQKRAELWRLLREVPGLSNRQLAHQVGMSPSWIQKWKRRLKNVDGTDIQLFLSLSRQRKTSPKKITEAIEAKILYLREYLTEQYQRRVGARNILYHLHQDSDLTRLGVYIPTAASTIHDVLVRFNRVPRPAPRIHVPFEPAEPLQVWEIDFTDVVTAHSTETDKQQHQVEVFEVVDTGTSIALQTQVSDCFDAKHTLMALIDLLTATGCPKIIRFDRDPRFVASWSVDKFPSAFVRFLLCLGIVPDVCPPHRPDRKPYVERFIRTQKEECIYPKRPATVVEAQILIGQHTSFYNLERPNQAVTCNNRPPSIALGDVPRLPRLPQEVDPDAWVKHYNKYTFRRQVRSNGTVTISKHNYYVGKRYSGHKALCRLDATTRQFDIYCQDRFVKSHPMKGLFHGDLPFEDYIGLMLVEAESEDKRLKAKRYFQRLTR